MVMGILCLYLTCGKIPLIKCSNTFLVKYVLFKCYLNVLCLKILFISLPHENSQSILSLTTGAKKYIRHNLVPLSTLKVCKKIN